MNTSNLKLKKPNINDRYDIAIFNENAAKIDATVGKIQGAVETALSSANTAQTKATDAQERASSAQSIAENAKIVSSDAQDIAKTALETSAHAQTIADHAQKTATSAQLSATLAQSDADIARTVAEQARQIATLYGASTTAAGTANKVVTCPEFTLDKLQRGTRITVQFTNANTTAQATALNLNINNTGNIAVSNTRIANWTAGAIVDFVYDGTVWQVATPMPKLSHFGTSTTAAATVGKAVTCAGFRAEGRVAGTRIAVTFTQANTAGSPTLNVNSTGAQAIQTAAGATTDLAGAWQAGNTVDFVHTGNAWRIVSVSSGSGSTNGSISVINNLISTNTTAALSANMGRELNERIDELKKFVLWINFDDAFVGQTFTVTGPHISHSDTVPNTRSIAVHVPHANTTYTITVGETSRTVTTSNFFGLYSVFVDDVSCVLVENTWEKIAEISESGRAPEYWNIGDEMDIRLSSGEILTLQICGFDHDFQGYRMPNAGITFCLKHLMSEPRYLDQTGNQPGPLSERCLGIWLENDLFSMLPPELQKVIKPVLKTTIWYEETLRLFILSESEVFECPPNSHNWEGCQYPIFTDYASKIKALCNGNGPPSDWWLRSSGSTQGTWWQSCAVGSHGFSMTEDPSVHKGICFGFCV